MSKFSKGDRVKRKNPSTQQDESGLVQDVSACYYFWGPDDEYVIVWDSGVREVLIASSVDHLLTLDGSQASSNSGPTFTHQQMSLFSFDDSDPITLPEGYKADLKGSGTCSHRWKRYVGFREEYEYCEICDYKKL